MTSTHTLTHTYTHRSTRCFCYIWHRWSGRDIVWCFWRLLTLHTRWHCYLTQTMYTSQCDTARHIVGWTHTYCDQIYTCEQRHMWCRVHMWFCASSHCEQRHMWAWVSHVSRDTCEQRHMWAETHVSRVSTCEHELHGCGKTTKTYSYCESRDIMLSRWSHVSRVTTNASRYTCEQMTHVSQISNMWADNNYGEQRHMSSKRHMLLFRDLFYCRCSDTHGEQRHHPWAETHVVPRDTCEHPTSIVVAETQGCVALDTLLSRDTCDPDTHVSRDTCEQRHMWAETHVEQRRHVEQRHMWAETHVSRDTCPAETHVQCRVHMWAETPWRADTHCEQRHYVSRLSTLGELDTHCELETHVSRDTCDAETHVSYDTSMWA